MSYNHKPYNQQQLNVRTWFLFFLYFMIILSLHVTKLSQKMLAEIERNVSVKERKGIVVILNSNTQQDRAQCNVYITVIQTNDIASIGT